MNVGLVGCCLYWLPGCWGLWFSECLVGWSGCGQLAVWLLGFWGLVAGKVGWSLVWETHTETQTPTSIRFRKAPHTDPREKRKDIVLCQ